MVLDSPPPKLPTSEVIASIRRSADAGVRVVVVEGFEVCPEGFMALLDLIHDVSEDAATAGEAAAEAEAFVNKHARDDILWEVWTDES